ncbi:abortive infection protein [Halorubrum sp. SD626R]|uniref:abortive infection protein n=1 Tax=Halorubrum sp. SD626R TaxID=1419722 RepID=UPI000ACF31B8|nr:abortive infection protein [Halorubrum sp. SD626R]TKX81443.1 abortive infection protein [Halorubrum sp. SD626R]
MSTPSVSPRRANVPFWTTVAVAALYLPASVAARALVDPEYAAAVAWLPRSVAEVAGAPLGTALAAALWLLVAGGFLYAFATELAAMRDRTAWAPPDKGYLVLAAGSLLAHPLTGLPFVFLVTAGYTLHRTLRVR